MKLGKRKLTLDSRFQSKKKIGTTQHFKNNFIIIKEPVLKKVNKPNAYAQAKVRGKLE